MKIFLPTLAFITLGLFGSLSAGCSGPDKSSRVLASELEEEFKERWVSQRVGELIASGAASDGLQARRMALQEFSERFEYVRGVQRSR